MADAEQSFPGGELRAWALSLLADQTSRKGRGVADELHRLCRVATVGLHVTGAAVTLRSTDGPQAVAASSDATSTTAAELEFGVGQGPAHDAFERGKPVLVSQLGGPYDGSWPEDDEVARGLVLSELATEMLLDSSTSSVDGEMDPDLKSALGFRGESYQAQWMALGIALPEALARMRAHALLESRDLVEVSVDIVEGRLAHARQERPMTGPSPLDTQHQTKDAKP